MHDLNVDELTLYITDHAAWSKVAAPRIAKVFTAIDDDVRLVESWRMLRADTKEIVWRLISEELRVRIKLLSAGRTRASAIDSGAMAINSNDIDSNQYKASRG